MRNLLPGLMIGLLALLCGCDPGVLVVVHLEGSFPDDIAKIRAYPYLDDRQAKVREEFDRTTRRFGFRITETGTLEVTAAGLNDHGCVRSYGDQTLVLTGAQPVVEMTVNLEEERLPCWDLHLYVTGLTADLRLLVVALKFVSGYESDPVPYDVSDSFDYVFTGDLKGKFAAAVGGLASRGGKLCTVSLATASAERKESDSALSLTLNLQPIEPRCP